MVSSQGNNKVDAVVVTTPYSTGCCIALDMQKRGYELICVWSKGFSENMKTHVPNSCKSLKWSVVLDEAGSVQETANLIRDVATLHNYNIVACCCGGEAGVDLADALSEELGLLTNGTHIKNRRDKKVQQELANQAGLRSIRQASGTCYNDEVEQFLQTESYPVIVKPLDSAGSDGVKLCRTYQEAKNHFNNLLGSPMVNGGLCEEVLCQEFLKGKEYVVDHVSRDGKHKCVMVWLYDKRPINGGDFVYFGDIPIDPKSPQAELLIPYVQKILDVLGVRNGPSHAEVIMTQDGPCMVEMNCRAHGGDGNWRPLCQAMTGGYDQVSAAVDSYVDEVAFENLPDLPPSPLLASGQCVDLVSYVEGTVKATPGYDIIKALPSFVCMESHITKGTYVKKTVDIATDSGSLVVVHSDPTILARDIAIIRSIESSNAMFEFEEDDIEYWQTRQKQFLSKPMSLDFVGGGFHNRLLSRTGKRRSEMGTPINRKSMFNNLYDNGAI